MKNITSAKCNCLLIFAFIICFGAQAQVILPLVEEFQITSTSTYETTPKLGNDGISDLVVFTARPDASGAGDIWYQRLAGEAALGSPVQVTSTDTDDELNDVWGDYIVYTAYNFPGSASGSIMLYRISSGTSYNIANAEYIQEGKIHDHYVVWREGGSWSAKVMLYDLDWLGTNLEPVQIAGTEPPTFQVDIADRFVVWIEYEDEQFDVVVRDLEDATTFNISNTPLANEANPSTFGSWVVWSESTYGLESASIKAMNVDTWQTQVIAENGAYNLNPSIFGDLIVWESDLNNTMDIFAHRLSTGETYQVTTQSNDQYLNDVLGNLIVYADNRNGETDIYASGVPDKVHIPDANFEQALIDLGIDSDGLINGGINREDVDGILTIDVSSPTYNTNLPNVKSKIIDLTGIEAFTSLTELFCEKNQLSNLDLGKNVALTKLDCSNNLLIDLIVSQNTDLAELYCNNNQLSNLDVGKNVALTKMNCGYNLLTSLDLSQNIDLTELSCQNNLLTGLDLNQMTNLTELHCTSNLLLNLDLSQNTDLIKLYCSQNLLTSLDINQNKNLTHLYCAENKLNELDLGQNTLLEYLRCDDNNLSSLDVTNQTNLAFLYCQKNQLKSLIGYENTSLSVLFCFENQLTRLDLSNNNALVSLGCNNNHLTSLNIKNGYNLSIDFFTAVSNPELLCIQVDDQNFKGDRWYKDEIADYSEDCSARTIIPDIIFEQALIDQQIDKEGILDQSVLTSSIATTISLNVKDLGINDLTGIEDFISLKTLSCSGNQLTNIDLSQNINLAYLNCYNNQLTSLDVSGNAALISLNCDNNLIKTLDLSNNKLLQLFRGYNNQLTGLDFSQNSDLGLIRCGNNQLTSLNVRNGNNLNISIFNATNNPLLTCIEVDNETEANAGIYPYGNWLKDSTASFSENCTDIIYLPDPNFEQALIDLGIDSDETINQRILRTDAEGVIFLDLSNPTENSNLSNVEGKIADLTGIEAFVDLLTLLCNYNSLSSLDLSQNTKLITLQCHSNQLTGLDVSANHALLSLTCHHNLISELDISQNLVLATIDCSDNQLSALDVSHNTLLTRIFCAGNQLIELDVSNNTTLDYLYMNQNNITSLDVTNNTDLTFLVCYDNNLQSLDVSQNTKLYGLACNGNQLSRLDLSNNPSFTELQCQDNQLTELYIKNGNNAYVTTFIAYNNLLSCINVDNELDDHSSWQADPEVIFSNDCGYNTQRGLDVKVSLLDKLTGVKTAEVTFDDVESSGETTIDVRKEVVEIGSNYIFEEKTVYDIETTAEYEGDVDIIIDYAREDIVNEDGIRLFHKKGETWEDITTSVDQENDEIYGTTSSLSPFVIIEDIEPPVLSGVPADLTLECSSDVPENPIVTATDNVTENVIVEYAELREDGNCINDFVLTKTWTASDDFGNSTSQSQVITVSDNTPPVFSDVPDEIVQENDPGECGAIVIYSEISADDNCQADVVLSFEPVSGSFFPVGTTSVSVTASDACGNTAVEYFDVIVSDTQLPTIEAPTDVAVNYDPTICGATVTFSDPVYSDNCGDLILERTDGTGLISGDLFPVGTKTISYVVTDPAGNAASASFSVTIENQPPVLSNLIVPLDPVAVGTPVSVSLDFEDDNLTEALIGWGDGNQTAASIGQGVITGEYAYSIPGVYILKVQVKDACGEEVSLIHRYIVVYDPTAGFVTGGGWIFSPEGAYKPDPLLAGKASFGFVAKYKKGSTVPDGNTEFQFKAGNLNFKSTDYEWLVIAGSKAMFKGSGTINGFGIYGFMLSAIDADLTPSADVDKFRIKIWDKEDDIVVYDNNLEIDDNADPTTEIGGGSIIIHKSNTKSAEIETGLFTKTENTNFSVYPNPFNDRLYFEFNSPKDVSACIDIFDVTGRKVKIVFNSFIEGGVNYNAEFVPASEVCNLYFYQLKIGEEVFYGKVVYNRR